jgi:hypothetical protein
MIAKTVIGIVIRLGYKVIGYIAAAIVQQTKDDF